MKHGWLEFIIVEIWVARNWQVPSGRWLKSPPAIENQWFSQRTKPPFTTADVSSEPNLHWWWLHGDFPIFPSQKPPFLAMIQPATGFFSPRDRKCMKSWGRRFGFLDPPNFTRFEVSFVFEHIGACRMIQIMCNYEKLCIAAVFSWVWPGHEFPHCQLWIHDGYPNHGGHIEMIPAIPAVLYVQAQGVS